MNKFLFAFLIVVISPILASSEDYKERMKEVCPKVWEGMDEAIPIVSNDTQMWGENSGEPGGDKDLARSNLSSNDTIATIDPASQEDLLEDPLTMASHCLQYKNYVVDYKVNGIEQPVDPDYSAGWMPAVVF